NDFRIARVDVVVVLTEEAGLVIGPGYLPVAALHDQSVALVSHIFLDSPAVASDHRKAMRHRLKERNDVHPCRRQYENMAAAQELFHFRWILESADDADPAVFDDAQIVAIQMRQTGAQRQAHLRIARSQDVEGLKHI